MNRWNKGTVALSPSISASAWASPLTQAMFMSCVLAGTGCLDIGIDRAKAHSEPSLNAGRSGDQTSGPRVIEVYPTTRIIPENTLKFHIILDSPVPDGQLPGRVYLTDQSGARLADVFLDPVHELWDPGHQRLTLLLDPARVKTGLHAYDTLGRALESGGIYRLVIESGWRDAHGNPARERFERQLRIGPEDRTSPRSADWSIAAPAPGTRDPVTATFKEPLDAACLAAFLRVYDADGQVLAGDIRVRDSETVWSFVPRRPWRNQEYRLVADARLEDLAGNNLAVVFDRAIDTTDAASEHRETPPATHALRFTVGAALDE